MELGGVFVIIWFTTIISWENTLAVELKRAQKRIKLQTNLKERESLLDLTALPRTTFVLFMPQASYRRYYCCLGRSCCRSLQCGCHGSGCRGWWLA